LPAFFFDSSAFVKRYVQEPGSSWVRSLTRPGTTDSLYIARITAVEVCSALTRRSRGGTLNPANALVALARFRKHLARHYLILEITPDRIDVSMRMAESHALRAYDAVQLAAALEVRTNWISAGLGGVTLISADRELNAAALFEGLAVDDPSLHP